MVAEDGQEAIFSEAENKYFAKFEPFGYVRGQRHYVRST